jgi:hypothetical protein
MLGVTSSNKRDSTPKARKYKSRDEIHWVLLISETSGDPHFSPLLAGLLEGQLDQPFDGLLHWRVILLRAL